MSQSRSHLSQASEEAPAPSAKSYERIPGRFRSWELPQIFTGGDYLVLQEGEQDDGTRTFAVYRRRHHVPESPRVPVTVVFKDEQIALPADVVRIDINDPELLALRLGGAPNDETRMRVRDILAQAPFLYEAKPDVPDFSDTLVDAKPDPELAEALEEARLTIEAMRAALPTRPVSTTRPVSPPSPAPTPSPAPSGTVNAITTTSAGTDVPPSETC